MGSSVSYHNKSTCTIVTIEGNIGSGKTTGKENLKKYICSNKNKDSTIFVDEPTSEWESIKDENGVPILVNLYSDIKRYAFRFQMMAYITRLKKNQRSFSKSKCENYYYRALSFNGCARVCKNAL